jgi:hypothetical protein
MEAAETRRPEELEALRDGLRERHSVDHFARAWYSGLAFLLLTGVWIKLLHDSVDQPLFLWPAALLCLSTLMLALRELRTGSRLLLDER